MSPRLALLLVLGFGCTRATFAPVADGSSMDEPAWVPSEAGAERGGTEAQSLDAGSEARVTCPAPAFPGCAPGSTGICDPVCQTGGCDWCTQKCSYVFVAERGASATACVGAGADVFPHTCMVSAAGSAQQSDTCAASSICLAPSIGDRLTYCFSLCRSQADCAYGVACSQRPLSAAGGHVAVCDPPYDECGVDGTCCDPLGNRGCEPSRTCRLVTPDPGTGHSRTVCELGYGDGRDGAPCASSRDCQVGSICANDTCRQACGSTAACPAGRTCTAWGSEFGYCS